MKGKVEDAAALTHKEALILGSDCGTAPRRRAVAACRSGKIAAPPLRRRRGELWWYREHSHNTVINGGYP